MILWVSTEDLNKNNKFLLEMYVCLEKVHPHNTCIILKLCRRTQIEKKSVLVKSKLFLRSGFFLTSVLHSLMQLKMSVCAHLGQSSQDEGTHLDFLAGSIEDASDWNLSVL